jgi:hypothetical protein
VRTCHLTSDRSIEKKNSCVSVSAVTPLLQFLLVFSYSSFVISWWQWYCSYC